MIQELDVTYKTPKPSVCMTWNGNKIKTFDGVTYSHELICSHTLVQDIVDGTFSVVLRSCPIDATQPCPHALEVFMQNDQFTFEINSGRVKMYTTSREIPIPVQMAGLKVTRSGTDVRIVLEQIPITITWDSKVMYFFLPFDLSKNTFSFPFYKIVFHSKLS
jgi:von Willebrand factor